MNAYVVIVEDDDSDGESRYVDAVYGPYGYPDAVQVRDALREEWGDPEPTRTFFIAPLSVR